MILTFFLYQNIEIKNLKSKINYLNNQIEYFKSQSEIQKNKVVEAKQQADEEIKKLEESTSKIMKEEVSKDCNKSMKWGILKAEELSK